MVVVSNAKTDSPDNPPDSSGPQGPAQENRRSAGDKGTYRQPERIEFLDSIRGIAAIAVVLFHSNMFNWPQGFGWAVNLPIVHILFNGQSAVAMFFVLSGFVLARPYLLPGQSRKVFLPTFYLRRYTRIWLPWFFIFCVSALAIKWGFRDYPTVPAYDRVEVRQSWHQPLTVKGALRQMALIDIYVPPDEPYLLPQDWSLGVEIKGSLMIPFFVFFARGRRFPSLMALAVLLLLLSSQGYFISFLLGVALARGSPWIASRLRQAHQWLRLLLLSLGILLSQSSYFAIGLLGLPLAPRGHIWIMDSIGCSMILAAVLADAGAQKVLLHPVLVFLGKISYSIYLWHMLILICVQPLIVYGLNQLGITTAVVLLPVSLVGNLLLTIGLAALSYRFVEQPTMNLGHWLTKKLQGRIQPQSVALKVLSW